MESFSLPRPIPKTFPLPLAPKKLVVMELLDNLPTYIRKPFRRYVPWVGWVVGLRLIVTILLPASSFTANELTRLKL